MLSCKYMATIQIRIDEKTKRSTKKVFKKLGLDMSSGIKLFLTQVDIRQRVPFELLTENGLTKKQENELLKAIKDAKAGKNILGPFKDMEAIEYLRKLM